MDDDTASRKLILTQQGQRWLSQFDPLDQDAATLLASSLALVSHNEFRRKLEDQINEAATAVEGPVALFAVRELPKHSPEPWMTPMVQAFYSCAVPSADGRSINPLDQTTDLGSEAIIVQIIRQITKANTNKFINHPTLEEMRVRRCRAIMLVDDFIGSGGRIIDFIQSLWMEPTIKSWHSTKFIAFHVVTYSAMESGAAHVRRHKANPTINFHREAPTLYTLPVSQERKNLLESLCRNYGKRALKGRKNMWLGYKGGMCSLIFEHGCPNNTPAILWETKDTPVGWVGLFPYRTISGEVASVFPPEIIRGDAVSILMGSGQKQLARSGALSRAGEVGQTVLLILALVAGGHRKRSTISFATGLSTRDCERILERCIKWNFLTPQRRITPQGLAELRAAKKFRPGSKDAIERGSDYYYPRQLRGAQAD